MSTLLKCLFCLWNRFLLRFLFCYITCNSVFNLLVLSTFLSLVFQIVVYYFCSSLCFVGFSALPYFITCCSVLGNVGFLLLSFCANFMFVVVLCWSRRPQTPQNSQKDHNRVCWETDLYLLTSLRQYNSRFDRSFTGITSRLAPLYSHLFDAAKTSHEINSFIWNLFGL